MKLPKFIAAALLAGLCLSAPALAAETPAVSARTAVLMDADSGRTLWEQDADEPRLIASTTKIMTALVAMEHCDLDMPVTIDPAWTGIEGSSMYLAPEQELTVRELLYGLMLASGNDAAVALACITAGSVEEFAALMNEKAAALGCENTHFENPNGLDSEAHYSSARDLARIARAAIRNEDFRRIASTYSVTVGNLTFTNHNRLLRECDGVFGVKTGYTEAAGRTLVTCCERDGITLICVTLSDPDDWRDHAQLYDWAYSEYVLDDAVPAGSLRSIPVIGGEAEEVTVSPETPLAVLHREGEQVTVSLRLPGFVYAAVDEESEAGYATAYVDGMEVGSVKLLYDGGVRRVEETEPTLWDRLKDAFGSGERKIYTLT